MSPYTEKLRQCCSINGSQKGVHESSDFVCKFHGTSGIFLKHSSLVYIPQKQKLRVARFGGLGGRKQCARLPICCVVNTN